MKNFIFGFRKYGCGLSQEELAKKCGLSQNTISAYECGIYSPTVINALKIARVLGVSVEELFELEGND